VGVRVDSGGVGLECEVAGTGRPVLLLHGFPDSARVWRHQIGPLTEGGCLVLAPDQRGYGRSDRPGAVADYRMGSLVADALAVLDACGVERCDVVGHDWGAAVAWVLAAHRPDRVDRLVTVSVGHPAAFALAGLEQRARSWYMLLFQFEGVAERWLSGGGWANFRQWSRQTDADAVIADLERPGALTAALNWYRANAAPESLVSPPPELPAVQAPTMGVWSSGDPALGEVQMTGSAAFVSAPWRYERVEGVGHWLPLEEPTALSALLVDFLAR
jgi:pimeloyl-ACP methyl ester carboxylesterase